MLNKPQRLSYVVEDEVKKAVAEGLSHYTGIPVDERQKQEEHGITLSNYILDALFPVIYNTHLKDILLIMEEGIGNMVMLTPALKMIRENNPRLNITVWCKESAAQVIRGWDVVDKVITDFDNQFYDLCITTVWGHQTSNKYKEVIEKNCKSKFDIQLKPFVPEVLQHVAASEFLDGTGLPPTPHCQIAEGKDKDDIVVKLSNIIPNTGGDKGANKYQDYIVFSDTSLRSFGWERKRWPYYKELAEVINKKYGTPILLVGDANDKKEFEGIDWPANVHLDFCGSINIPQLAYLIKKSTYCIGNDTGPIHISAAVGAKTYAIFGPTTLAKSKPYGKDVTIIQKSMGCAPCQYTDKWNNCSDFSCMDDLSAVDVYNNIYHSEKNVKKKKVLLVGDFSGGHMRVEHAIQRSLTQDLKMKVIPYHYRQEIKKAGPVDSTFGIIGEMLQKGIDYVLICGGQGIVPQILDYRNTFSPETKVFSWYADQRGGLEQWWVELGKVTDMNFWTTGAQTLHDEYIKQVGKDFTFMPIPPDEKVTYPIDVPKKYDVVFFGTPHSEPRINLITKLIEDGINVKLFGDGQWPEHLSRYASPGVYGEAMHQEINAAKIVINTNMFNEIPLAFSDRYFYGLAAKVCTLSQHIPQIEEVFGEEGESMSYFKTPEEASEKIKHLLANKEEMDKIAASGYEMFKSKLSLKHALKEMFI